MKCNFLLLALCLLNACAEKTVPCEDLLLRYAVTTPELEFVACKKGKDQTVAVATYKIANADVDAVEQFLMETYGLSSLKFACCGWEAKNGKPGFYESAELKKMNPYYTLAIAMFANAEIANENGEIYLERDRNKVEFFVVVELLEI